MNIHSPSNPGLTLASVLSTRQWSSGCKTAQATNDGARRRNESSSFSSHSGRVGNKNEIRLNSFLRLTQAQVRTLRLNRSQRRQGAATPAAITWTTASTTMLACLSHDLICKIWQMLLRVKFYQLFLVEHNLCLFPIEMKVRRTILTLFLLRFITSNCFQYQKYLFQPLLKNVIWN